PRSSTVAVDSRAWASRTRPRNPSAGSVPSHSRGRPSSSRSWAALPLLTFSCGPAPVAGAKVMDTGPPGRLGVGLLPCPWSRFPPHPRGAGRAPVRLLRVHCPDVKVYVTSTRLGPGEAYVKYFYKVAEGYGNVRVAAACYSVLCTSRCAAVWLLHFGFEPTPGSKLISGVHQKLQMCGAQCADRAYFLC